MLRYLEPGDHEAVKAMAHGTLGLLACLCVGYNGAAFLARRERHLAVNTVVYGALVVFEALQWRRHRRRQAGEA